MKRVAVVIRKGLTKHQARYLLNTVYSDRYGRDIRYETPVSLRIKITQIEMVMDQHRHTCPELFQFLARVCTDYERVIMLHDILL